MQNHTSYHFKSFSAPPVAVAVRKTRASWACDLHCSPFGMMGMDKVAKCIEDCERRRGRMLEATPEKVPVAERQARGAQECIYNCAIMYPAPFGLTLFYSCKNNCEKQGRATDEKEDFSIYSSGAPAQPINPGQLTTFFPLFSMLIKSLNLYYGLI
jgi:hypothetical protein